MGSQTKSLIFLTTAGIPRPGLEPGAFATRERYESGNPSRVSSYPKRTAAYLGRPGTERVSCGGRPPLETVAANCRLRLPWRSTRGPRMCREPPLKDHSATMRRRCPATS